MLVCSNHIAFFSEHPITIMRFTKEITIGHDFAVFFFKISFHVGHDRPMSVGCGLRGHYSYRALIRLLAAQTKDRPRALHPHRGLKSLHKTGPGRRREQAWEEWPRCYEEMSSILYPSPNVGSLSRPWSDVVNHATP